MPTRPILQKTSIMTSQHHLILDLFLFLFKLDNKPISHYYGYRDKDDHSLDSYMWYSTGDDDCSDNNYDP
ncbi:hypothetical protein F8M41_008516 [Gigaspora margarita]|uniref:Uncharacterized protein n=1 Tax=Gigaspora margarita TaxID=4874 RepID=A0A8H4B464_GIGMA|nr:hypothetical protein F8M41_008516 [Gigaspora margarita]